MCWMFVGEYVQLGQHAAEKHTMRKHGTRLL
jgi:hypothetical protein